MRAVGVIVRAGWYQLDGIAAKDSQVAKVLLPHRQIPGIVRIAFWTEPQLMSAQREPGCAGDGQIIIHGRTATLHVHFPKQSADAEKNTPRIVSDDIDRRVWASTIDENLVTLRARRFRQRFQGRGVGAGD